MPEWWDQLGTMYQGLSGFPALASDMNFNGPQDDFRYTLMSYLNGSQVPLEVYSDDSSEG